MRNIPSETKNELVKVPDALSDEESVGEPLAMLMSGVGQTPLELGQTFAIIGTGYMGLGFLQLMRAKGAGKIIAIDVRPEGLANAKRFGADELLTTDAVPPEYIVDVWTTAFSTAGSRSSQRSPATRRRCSWRAT